MNWKVWVAFLLGALLVLFPMLFLEINILITYITAFVVLMTGYILWQTGRNKKLSNILEEECDPYKAIEAMEKHKELSKRREFQNACNLNIAVGYIAAGQYPQSGEILKNMDLDGKNSKSFQITYQLACFVQYINTEQIQEAEYEYENHIKHLECKTLVPIIKCAIEASVLEYNYRLNKSTDSAKFYLAQLNFLYDSNKTKLTKRMKLGLLYNMANLELDLGQNDEAIKKFKKVAEHGNKLNIAENSREKLRSLIVA